jgi:protein TonB
MVFCEMLNSLPSSLRLALCLLLSIGAHGGLAFYDWATEPSDSTLMAAPVMVSLLPATETLPNMAKVLPSEPPVPVPARKSLSPAPKPKELAPVQKIKKILVKAPLDAESLNKALDESIPAEMVCMTPQEVVADVSPVIENVDTGKREAKIVQAALATSESKVVSDSSFSSTSTLVEAIPNYRSNPLPEYPRMARRKHWEGVVWLLVDVTSEGSVDDLEIEETCGHKLLDRAAERTVKRWQFTPATRAGVPVSSQVRIPVRFRLEDG